MGCYKIGSECCNNCVHWDCHSERKFIGNPPNEVYTDSNCDKCFLTGRNTLSKDSCGMFKHLGGITRTFAAEQKHAGNDYINNMLDACDETSRIFLQSMIGSIRLESAERIEEIAQNQRRIEAANSENEKRGILIRNGMDSNASNEDQQAFEALYRGACDGEAEGLLYLGEAFRTNRYGAVLDAEKAVQLFKMAASKGSSDAELRLADCYLRGEGVGKDEKIGRAWLARAAEHGDAIAKKKIAQILEEEKRMRLIEEQAARDRAYQDELAEYVENNGMDPDASDMAKLLFSAMFESAKDGQVDAQLELADAYANHTKGAIEDKARALFWYKKAAKQGNTVAQNKVGRCYCEGVGTEKNLVEAFKWFKMSAEAGDAHGQYELGCAFGKGSGVERNYGEAFNWFVKSGEQGNSAAQINVGDFYKTGKGVDVDYEKALMWYEKALDKSGAKAKLKIGQLYLDGKGVKKDEAKAFSLLKESADEGNGMAMAFCGLLCRDGRGTDVNKEKAYEWFKKSAEKGVANGKLCLARAYRNGDGVAQQLDKARELFKELAEIGNPRGCYLYGDMLEKGEGCDADINKAKVWFKKAADAGDKDAKAALERIG